ncbi:MAG: MjaI family restriction endonuclease [Candidatus Bathyarchaeota archaeon]|nr:MjaI family restriction endonuclease [Candidatus Termiticorpusculum sp.]
MSELIVECPKGSYQDWVNWYTDKMPAAVEDATKKVYEMIQCLQSAITQIDKELVRKWVEDLVLTKTFAGFCFQESIIKIIAKQRHEKYQRATPEEESNGIDGYIGKTPVSIKPITYKTKSMLHEKILCETCFLRKTQRRNKSGI